MECPTFILVIHYSILGFSIFRDYVGIRFFQQVNLISKYHIFVFCSNSMIYKDDMNAEKFEAFLKEVCEELEKKYGKKVAIVMDNASYHTVMVSIKN